MNNPNLSKLNDGIQSVVTTVLRGFKKNSDPLDIQLGIWGTAGAGKTTYLGRLYTELLKSEIWTVYFSTKSRVYINEIVDGLENGRCPVPNNILIQKLTEYDYKLTGEKEPFKDINVMLRFIDAPGEFYEDPERAKERVEVEGKEVLIDILEYLSGCHGIIFLLDPEQEPLDEKKRLSFILPKLMQHFHEQYVKPNAKVPKLQQYMAFCVTKVDQGDLWQESKDPEKLAKRLMGTNTYKYISNNWCLKPRLNFFPVSSIGRYKEGDQWKEVVNAPKQHDSQTNVPEQMDNQSNKESINKSSILDEWLKPKIEFESQEKPNNKEPESSFTDSSDGGKYTLSPSFPSESEQSSKGLTTFDVEKEPVPIGILEPVEWLIKEIRANPPSLPNQTSTQAEQPPLPPFSR
jgi:hypothetical protein